MPDDSQNGNDLVDVSASTTRDKTSIGVPRSLVLELKMRALERERVVNHRVTLADVIRELLNISGS